jgi:hypothetical protein
MQDPGFCLLFTDDLKVINFLWLAGWLREIGKAWRGLREGKKSGSSEERIGFKKGRLVAGDWKMAP